MMTLLNAKKIGIRACIEQLGQDFCEKYADTSSTAYGELDDNRVFCFIGVDDRPQKPFDGKLTLSSKQEDQFPYWASCIVSRESGTYSNLEVVRPR